MKKFTLLLLLFLASATFSQTTVEEYNYLTKGYAIQKDAGLDMKQGYSIESLFDYKTGSYSFSYSVFYTDNNLSAILVDAKSNTAFGINQYYICIPFGDDLMPQYDEKMMQFDKDFLRAYNSGLTRLFSNVFYNSLIAEINKNPIQKKPVNMKKK